MPIACYMAGFPKRYLTCGLMFLSLMICYMLRFSIGLLITEMVVKPEVDDTLFTDRHLYCPMDKGASSANTSSSYEHTGEFHWDEYTQGIILSSFFWGYVVAHIPAAMLVGRIGGKYPLAFALLVSSVGSLLIPTVARSFGAWGLVVVRVAMGLGQGFTMTSINELLSKWAPIEERGRLGGIVFSGSYIGNTVSMFLVGVVLRLTDGDWAVVFYMYGAVGIVWVLVWQLMGYSRPEDHPGLLPEEKLYLEEYSAKVNLMTTLPPVPWSDLLSSIPLWTTVIGVVGSSWGLFTMLSDLPKYMITVLHFSTAQTGVWTALLYVAMFIGSWVSALVVDYFLAKNITSIANTRKIFASIALLGPAISVIFATYSGCNNVLFLVCMSLALGTLGVEASSLKLNVLDLTTNYAGPAMALVNGGGAVTGILSPYIIGLIVSDNTMQQWRHVFFITTAVMVVADVIFIFFASGNIQPWNDPNTPEDRRSSEATVEMDAVK